MAIRFVNVLYTGCLVGFPMCDASDVYLLMSLCIRYNKVLFRLEQLVETKELLEYSDRTFKHLKKTG